MYNPQHQGRAMCSQPCPPPSAHTIHPITSPPLGTAAAGRQPLWVYGATLGAIYAVVYLIRWVGAALGLTFRRLPSRVKGAGGVADSYIVGG